MGLERRGAWARPRMLRHVAPPAQAQTGGLAAGESEAGRVPESAFRVGPTFRRRTAAGLTTIVTTRTVTALTELGAVEGLDSESEFNVPMGRCLGRGGSGASPSRVLEPR